MPRRTRQRKLIHLTAVLVTASCAACSTDDGTEAPADVAVDTSTDAADTAAERDVEAPDAVPPTPDVATDTPGDDVHDAAPAPPTPDERFGAPPVFETGEQTTMDPFEGVRIVSRVTSVPRPLHYHVVQIDTAAEGLGFRVTPPNGDDPRETTRETVRTWVTQTGAQLGINLHFFRPWPPEDAYADCLGLSVSDGDAYSPFEEGWPFAIALGPDNAATFVRRDDADPTGFASLPAVDIDDAFGAREQIVTAGVNTGVWEELHPRTAAGITAGGDLVFLVADGRQDGVSEGMTTPEVADVLIAFGVVDALNLDGGGSSTLVVADPDPRVVNAPVGFVVPNTERDNGCNLAVFATPRE